MDGAVFRPPSPEEPDSISRPESGSSSPTANGSAALANQNRRVSLPPMRLTSILEQDEKDKVIF